MGYTPLLHTSIRVSAHQVGVECIGFWPYDWLMARSVNVHDYELTRKTFRKCATLKQPNEWRTLETTLELLTDFCCQTWQLERTFSASTFSMTTTFSGRHSGKAVFSYWEREGTFIYEHYTITK